MTSSEGLRLQKVLSQAGIASRRVAEDLIEQGRVSVNGVIAQLGARVDTESDVVEVDGVHIGVKKGLVYYLVNKPAGVISTVRDTHGRPTVTELVPEDPPVVPVGRLDAETEGLLLLTNDGDLTFRLTHPRFGVEKEYLVSVRGRPSRSAVRELRDGVELDDGMTAPAKVAMVDESTLKITIHEGRNRQVRRMCAAVGHEVVRLVRFRIGPLVDPHLKPGEYRDLTQAEVRELERASSGINPSK